MLLVGHTRPVEGNAEILCANRNLEGADLVDHGAVQTDRVRSAGKHVHAAGLHQAGGHIVRDHRRLKTHLAANRGGQPSALEIGPGLGAEELQILPPAPGLAEHHAHDGLCKTLGHDCAVVREHVHKVVCALADS